MRAREIAGPRSTHETIRSFGYDWERIADPAIAPKFPLKVYLPRSVEDIEQAVREARLLGQRLKIRGNGHSSNGMVLEEGGSVLSTVLLDRILDVDMVGRTVTVQPGVTPVKIDEHLRPLGFGLPVLADNTGITAGGLASVGGVSPASHRSGLFVDNIRAVELVDWDGHRRTLSREANPLELNRVLGGTGRHGVIAALTLDIVPGDKWTTITENRRFLTCDFNRFLDYSHENIERPGEALLQRALWVEYPLFGWTLCAGQFSAYRPTVPSPLKRWRERIAYGILHLLGAAARRLPWPLGRLANRLASLGLLLSPRYATVKNVEILTDKVVDQSVGDPPRMLTAFAPMRTYHALMRSLHAVCTRWRDTHGCFTFIGLYVIGIRSAWLAAGTDERFCDLVLYLGARPEKMGSARLDAIVAEIDAACLEHGAFRYMHTRLSADLAARARLNPNERHAVLPETRIETAA